MAFRKPRIPMLPEQVIPQLIHAVMELPPRPRGFAGQCDFADPMPDEIRPRGNPRTPTYLFTVEWKWSEHHDRLDSYYLSRRKGHWLLWIGWDDENDWDRSWRWALYAWAPTRRVPPKVAACCLLIDAWKSETLNRGLDHFNLIDDVGLLSVPEIFAMARAVWPMMPESDLSGSLSRLKMVK